MVPHTCVQRASCGKSFSFYDPLTRHLLARMLLKGLFGVWGHWESWRLSLSSAIWLGRHKKSCLLLVQNLIFFTCFISRNWNLIEPWQRRYVRNQIILFLSSVYRQNPGSFVRLIHLLQVLEAGNSSGMKPNAVGSTCSRSLFCAQNFQDSCGSLTTNNRYITVAKKGKGKSSESVLVYFVLKRSCFCSFL